MSVFETTKAFITYCIFGVGFRVFRFSGHFYFLTLVAEFFTTKLNKLKNVKMQNSKTLCKKSRKIFNKITKIFKNNRSNINEISNTIYCPLYFLLASVMHTQKVRNLESTLFCAYFLELCNITINQ